MRWVFAKIDSLIGTIFAAAMGLLTSQFLAFIQQYRQLLNGRLAEAQRNVRVPREAEGVPAAPAYFQDLTDRVTELADALNALSTANPFAVPIAFIFTIDLDSVFAALKEFEPSIPIDTASLVYGISGMVIGWALYGVIKRLGGRLIRGKV